MGVRSRRTIAALLAALLLALPLPAGAVAKRVFSVNDLARMGRDWERMDPEPFLKKYKLYRPMFTRLRRENEGLFPERKKGLYGKPQKLEAVKVGYLEVVAGLKTEKAMLEEHGIDYPQADWLRGKPEHAPDVPLIKTRMPPKSAPQLAPEVVADWSKVRQGKLGAATFRQRHPQVRAAELAALQDWQRSRIEVKSGTRGKLAESVMKLSATEVEQARMLAKPPPKIPAEKLERLRQEWHRVEKHEISQNALADEVGIPRHQLVAWKQVNPGEFIIPKATLTADEVARVQARWHDVKARKISLGRMLKEEGIVPWRFSRHRDETGEFSDAARSKFDGKVAAVEGQSTVYNGPTVTAAKALFARFHRSQITQAELHEQLKKIGVTPNHGVEHLRTLDGEAFASREEFLDKNFDKIIDDLILIAQKNKSTIKRWADFTELAENSGTIKSKWGPLRVSAQKGWVVDRDRKGDRRLYSVLEEIGLRVMSKGR
jgi:hypothetical protein